MTSEPTEPQGTDEQSGDTETTGEDPGDERVEARAQEPTRVESDDGADDERDKSVVPAPSETSDETDSGAATADDSSDAAEQEVAEEDAAEEDASEEDATGEPGAEDDEIDDTSEADLEEASDPEEAESEQTRARSRTYVDLEDQAVEWLGELFERMNYDAEADIRFGDEGPRIDIRGPDAGRLLGQGKLGPKAVEGIETLLQSVFSEDDSASDVYVDVGGRRRARKEMLQEVAVSMADKAVELDDKMTVSGLNSTERRIIHRQLREYDGVDTESVGEGIFRRLTITPTA